ncbi:hypothetical protein [Clostridium kluyveri]|uniref:Dipeptidyl-peptidase IV n=2 Tax=Clostridium kluyveri TaxID=1534 RepID=A5N130_CLOK5|nr:hypothetical protein [Clostridium kluyveri]EDK34826.1 Conserved hypothetical protein [Clostridium kluyveri DSM 555]BAH07556.1 hypothetical protein CKR_2505 [Clostridium kluyveri NBRC 12016]
MKIFKRTVIWIAISLIIQFAGLLYINNYFLSSEIKLKTKKIVKSEPKKSEVEIKIPEDAENITVSFDGRYLAYCQENTLKVVDSKTGDEKSLEFEDGVQVSFYKWLQDRSRILIAEKEDSQEGSKFELSYYEVDKDIKENIKELDWSDTEAKIDNIQESHLTNVIYVKMESKGMRTTIYRVDIMKKVEKIPLNSYIVGQIGILYLQDKLIYEDSVHNDIYITDEDEPLTIHGIENKPVWVGIDENDRVYIGDEKDGKISNIYCGTIDSGGYDYQNINLNQFVDKKNVFVMPSGKIYINNALEGIVQEVGSGKQYTYKGNFIGIYDGGIASVSNGKLEKTLLN